MIALFLNTPLFQFRLFYRFRLYPYKQALKPKKPVKKAIFILFYRFLNSN